MLASGLDQQCCEECGTRLYQASDRVPSGSYLRVDDGSFHCLSIAAAGPLPASLDGHVARYRAAAAPCACERRRVNAERTVPTATGQASDATEARSRAVAQVVMAPSPM